jgi:hypothetical protein
MENRSPANPACRKPSSAVKVAGLDHRAAKPWSREGLLNVVRTQPADYVVDDIQEALPCASILRMPPPRQAVKSRAARG